ncbi:EAL domain-containing protein [Thalassotalea sp. M1531]|uniref:cyclic-guanylate-specific phosphodiesterase n=1 Tax=Thalassotalea algicola TaxID=2716224 RepID=A0A7Y0LAR1_9GAMM|nr:EAL domain-containing protein [Thalassotalea algicola]NMP30758.1 EAL domain-containing protein [Thalassotalea algicola]
MENDLNQVLKSIDCIAFKFQGSGQFDTIFNDTEWSPKLLKNLLAGNPVSLYGNSLFLDDFLRDAEAFWQQTASSNTLSSGVWTEQFDNGVLGHFEAQAIKADRYQLLVIKNLAEQFDEKQKTLQVAREMILANENILARHDYAQERVASLVSESDNLKSILDSVSRAVDAINTGILIADNEFNCLMENPAVYNLFNLQADKDNGKALTIILQLLDKQYPEFNRIICSDQSWQGELCWMQPPFSMKWLMLSIIPVKNSQDKLSQWIFIATDISRVKHLQQQNEKLTLIDNLTELPNRQYFWNALESFIARGMPFYVLYVDITNFKIINDEFGHNIGDEVLFLISEQIKKSVKKDDIVARIGGDEFGVILQGVITDSQCKKILERITNLTFVPYFHQKINNLNIALKVGVAAYPQDGDSVERLIKCTSIAASYVKDAAELPYAFYTEEMELESQRLLKLKKELDNALEYNQFELYFQPIYFTPDKKVAKVEVLVRWNHPELGLVMPGSFIPLAEETGLIIPLGKWVIEHACQALGELNYRGIDIGMAINLSPRQLSDRTLGPFIEQTIQEFKIDAKKIELEVTEGLLIYNFETVLSQLQALRAVGISLSVDDFGTGYSSLSYLKRLPINALKIDRSFIMDIANDANDKAIVSAVIAMAHKLNLLVVAEGVEQQNQLQFLADNHCDFIQGFLLCKPQPFERLCLTLEQK